MTTSNSSPSPPPRGRRTTRSVLAAALAAVLVARALRSAGPPPPFLFFAEDGTVTSHVPPPPPAAGLTEEQREAFSATGVLLLRGLLPPDSALLRDAVAAGEALFQQPAGGPLSTDRLLAKLFSSRYARLAPQTWRRAPGLARVAFGSRAPALAADLLGLAAPPMALRILKDALFGQVPGGIGCGFHVDDRGFWPATDDSTGVNVWIALSQYNASTPGGGGGIRVAPGSHTAPWAAECRAAIAGAPGKTCNIHELHPECSQRLEETSVVYDMAPGDALLWDRWVFHRQEPLGEEAAAAAPRPHKLRYTVRYVPSDAVADGMLHPSVPAGAPFDSPYHPQVWPQALPHEMVAVRDGLDADLTWSGLAWLLSKLLQKRLVALVGDGRASNEPTAGQAQG